MFLTVSHKAQAEIEAVKQEGATAHNNGLGIHHNPYDYMYQQAQADYWDRGWKEAAQ